MIENEIIKVHDQEKVYACYQGGEDFVSKNSYRLYKYGKGRNCYFGTNKDYKPKEEQDIEDWTHSIDGGVTWCYFLPHGGDSTARGAPTNNMAFCRGRIDYQFIYNGGSAGLKSIKSLLITDWRVEELKSIGFFLPSPEGWSVFAFPADVYSKSTALKKFTWKSLTSSTNFHIASPDKCKGTNCLCICPEATFWTDQRQTCDARGACLDLSKPATVRSVSMSEETKNRNPGVTGIIGDFMYGLIQPLPNNLQVEGYQANIINIDGQCVVSLSYSETKDKYFFVRSNI